MEYNCMSNGGSRRKTTETTIIWGLRVTPEQKRRWQLLAFLRRMPVSGLISEVLNDLWDHHQGEILAEAGQKKLSGVFTQPQNKDNTQIPPRVIPATESDIDFLKEALMNFSVRGVSANTRLYLKGLSAANGRPI